MVKCGKHPNVSTVLDLQNGHHLLHNNAQMAGYTWLHLKVENATCTNAAMQSIRKEIMGNPIDLPSRFTFSL